VHSVREFGVLQPVVVRLNDEGKYELIMGSVARAPLVKPG
jgi:ParB family chromosome partitioning protein